jgi:poly(A) polymerase
MLLIEPLREACIGARDRVEAAYRFLEAIVDRLNMPRRIAEPVRRIAAILPRIEAGRTGRFARTSLYPVAHEIASLYATAQGRELEGAPTPTVTSSEALASNRSRRRRRRR